MPKGIPNKKYTGQYKQMVVETLRQEQLRYHEAERRFGVVRSRITAWERIYLTEGPEGLYIERRGSKGRPRKIPKEIEEDRIAENQRFLKDCRTPLKTNF